MGTIENRKIMVCPLNGKMCVEGRREDFPCIDGTKLQQVCRWWIGVQGHQGQGKEITDLYDCAAAWAVTVGVNVARESCGTTASVDKMHNAFVNALPPRLRPRLERRGAIDVKANDGERKNG